MSLTIEQVLTDAKKLVERLRDHDNAAEGLIEQSSTLNKKVEAMKQVWIAKPLNEFVCHCGFVSQI